MRDVDRDTGGSRLAGGIVGREIELGAIAASLASVPAVGARAIVIAGPPGIGKTTVWDAAVAHGRENGWTILSCRAAGAEATLSYAALGDLFTVPLDAEAAATLAAPQRAALDVALLRTPAARPGADRRGVALATLALLRAISAANAVLLAVDDVQWIDRASADALSFALRRLTADPVAVVVTLREDPALIDPLALERSFGERATRVSLAPVPVDVLARLLSVRTRERLPKPTHVRLHEASGGNPFFALEMVRAMRRDPSRTRPGEPLPVPDDLGSLLQARIRRLPSATRDALQLSAAASRPTVSLLVDLSAAADALVPAEEADVVRIDGDEIRFTHPLLAAAVYAGATSPARRRVHARLADIVEDREERARHLALASVGPNADVAQELEDAAALADRRGAPGAAAELADLARRSTPSDAIEDLHRRGLAVAEYRFVAGDAAEANRVAEAVLGTSRPGIARAGALYLLSAFNWTDVPRLRALLDEAEREAPAESPLRASVLADLGWTEIQGGHLRTASAKAREAIELAERVQDPGPLSLGLVTAAYARFMLGEDVEALLDRALTLEDELSGPETISYALASARNTRGAQAMWAGDLDRARGELERYHRELVDAGRHMMLWEGLIYLSELESRAGNFDRALAYADELVEILDDAGYEQARETGLWVRALAEAHLGLVDQARTDATDGLRLAERHQDLFHVITNRSVLGFLELSIGDHAAAWTFLEPLPALLDERGIVEPGVYPFVPDAVEALVGLGRLDRAAEVLDPFARAGTDLGRPLVVATSERCLGLIAAAVGDVATAQRWLRSAIERDTLTMHPFELARTHLILGNVARRAKQRRTARSSLLAALAGFERLGTSLWADKAHASLARIAGRRSSPGLTETELRVASLVAEGRTNREVADALFVSLKTVEANLSRVYSKLGIRSRRELPARLPGGPSSLDPGSRQP